MKVYVYAICKNESKFALRWMKSMSEADGVYVLDTGSEGFVFWLNNMHSRHGYRWTHPVHEVLERTVPEPTRQIYIEGIQLDHRADDTKPRSQYLPLLEMSVAECPDDDRNMHYLGREYYFYRRWEDAIRTLEHHLSMPSATWADERCASMRYIARCQNALGRAGEAKRWLWRAIGEAPHLSLIHI